MTRKQRQFKYALKKVKYIYSKSFDMNLFDRLMEEMYNYGRTDERQLCREIARKVREELDQ